MTFKTNENTERKGPNRTRIKTSAKRGKMRVTIAFGLAPDWLKKQLVCSDWLEQVTLVTRNKFLRPITELKIHTQQTCDSQLKTAQN